MVEFTIQETMAAPTDNGIYSIRASNGMNLVGQTSRGFKRRFREHVRALQLGKHDNPRLQNHFNKHGEGDLRFVILEVDPGDINRAECDWIAKLQAMHHENGFNLREGGSYGLYSSELRKRVSDGIRNSEKSKAAHIVHCKPIKIKDAIGNVHSFASIVDCCKSLNINPSTVVKLRDGIVKRSRFGYSIMPS